MRVELEHLDARGLSVDLTPDQSIAQQTGAQQTGAQQTGAQQTGAQQTGAQQTGAQQTGAQQKIRIVSAAALAGVLEQTGATTRISPLVAEQLVLDALALVFGTVLLREQGQATFNDARAVIEKDAQRTAIDFEAASVHAASLGVDVGTVHVRGETRMREMRLWVRDGEGQIDAAQLQVAHMHLRLGSVGMSAIQLNAERVQMAWGAEGFRLEADLVAAPQVELTAGALRLHAEGLVLHALRVHPGDISFRGAELNAARLDFSFAARDAEAEVTEPASIPSENRDTLPSKPKVFDFGLLDGLSGELNVDAAVDMSVPVIGRRRATHRLRLGIEDGSIDYRELESNLSGLEESLLDFSVRNGALVLELGIPLLPTRGLGKPLVLWDLGPDDYKLAERRRVRLSVLPSYRLAGQERRSEPPRKSEPPRDPESSSSFALRSLDLENIDVRMTLNALPEPMESIIRWLAFASLQARGALHHDPQQSGVAHEGAVEAQLTGLDLGLAGLPVGTSILDLSRLQLAELTSLHVGFLGLTPTRVQAELKRLVLSTMQLRG